MVHRSTFIHGYWYQKQMWQVPVIQVRMAVSVIIQDSTRMATGFVYLFFLSFWCTCTWLGCVHVCVFWVEGQAGEIGLLYKSALPARSCLSAFANTFDANPSRYRLSSGASFSVFLSYMNMQQQIHNYSTAFWLINNGIPVPNYPSQIVQRITFGWKARFIQFSFLL